MDKLIIRSPFMVLNSQHQGLTLKQITDYAEQVLPKDFAALKQQLLNGEFKNQREQRNVTHCLARGRYSVLNSHSGSASNNRFISTVQKLRSGNWHGATGKAITDVVNIGVGGSDLGPMMGSFALKEFADDASLHKLNVHFVSSMDGGQLHAVLPIVDPETTLFIIASKSFGTVDTFANVDTVKQWVAEQLTEKQWLASHVIGISSNVKRMTDYGIPPQHQFSIDEGVGGRFSMWSAIGLAIALSVGVGAFQRMLKGAAQQDQHFVDSGISDNIPVLMAVLGVYNRWERGINNLAILPYDGRLRYLPTYLQQLDMESNGKAYSYDNRWLEKPCGPIIWGGFGPNGQHAFFQHLQQSGEAFTADFVAVLERQAVQFDERVEQALERQQRLAATSCLAQWQLLFNGAGGKQDPANCYPGHAPTNLLYMEQLTPESFGALIATYEHKVFTQGVIFGVNSFDQPGIEKGKILAQQYFQRVQHSTLPSKALKDLFESSSTQDINEEVKHGD